MRSDEPRAAAMFQGINLLRQNVQSIGVNHHRLLRALDQPKHFAGARFSQSGPDRPDVDLFLEQVAIGAHRFDHRFTWRGGGNNWINFL